MPPGLLDGVSLVPPFPVSTGIRAQVGLPAKVGRVKENNADHASTTDTSALRDALPRLGAPGSRSALLHADGATGTESDARFDLLPVDAPVTERSTINQLRRFFALRWMGTAGSLLIAFGGLGAGALPVVGNPYDNVPSGALMSRLLQSSSALVFVGIGLLVVAWVGMAPFVGHWIHLPRYRWRASEKDPRGWYLVRPATPRRVQRLVTEGQMWRTWAGWVVPLIFTAPLFTQDIYSYLANGSIVHQGLDPYAGGPVEILGADNRLARSVPFIWANSPSPYGPVSLGLAAAISVLTHDSIMAGVIAHRLLSLAGIVAAGWATGRLARRCRVSPAAALWLGVLNPLAILHLVGGIHNESILLGLVLVGVELALRGIDKLGRLGDWRWLGWLIASGVLISCAGMVKVTGFIGLGFTGMALARCLALRRGYSTARALATAVAVQVVTLAASILAVSAITGIGLGWVTGQGGAATIRSWISISTDIGVITGFLGMLLGLGDHTDAILSVTRAAGVLLAGAFMLRMLWATYRGAIHPMGGLGVATAVLVALFPVVHPWYILWAVFPLAAWANRYFFRTIVVAYSVPMSFFVLPRGLGLPPGTVLVIYLAALGTFAVVVGTWALLLRRAGLHDLD